MNERLRRENEKLLDELAATMLERWRNGESLTTLNLRAACHAAQREDDKAAERQIASEIELREAQGR